ncbi:MAG: choice-of-anchor L domain-containing protein [Verrucomicrobiae bacterium]|nr:choice-of-anchor L domain-containing protein [Verrucomicrobiae bacterium]
MKMVRWNCRAWTSASWLTLALLGCGLISAHAEIIIIPTTNAVELANAVTAGGAGGIQVTSVSLKANRTGSAVSSGLYSLSGPIPDTYGLRAGGIVLSTGNVADYRTGPNNGSATTTAYNKPGDAQDETLLDQITGGTFSHNDVTRMDITFNMLPGFDTVFFQVVFGSEEYPEFVGSPFNDGFGLFLNGSNIAFAAGSPININHPGMAALAGTELDGVLTAGGTAVLQFSAVVGAGSANNTLTIIVADTSDALYDTTVYVTSLGAGAAPIPELPAPPPPPPPGGACVTRPVRFWMQQVDDPAAAANPQCVTLLNALKANSGGVDVGFMKLPSNYWNGDDKLDAIDTTMEALGFGYRSVNVTGEAQGLQTDRNRASLLCKERKRLAAEIIAATANQMYLRTNPSDCFYSSGGSNVYFSADIIDQARAAAAGEDLAAIRAATLTLRRFNLSGARAQFPAGFEQCAPYSVRLARAASRDGTTRTSCPAFNDGCDTAEVITRFPFTATVDLIHYSNREAGGSCSVGGRDVMWRISPPVAAPGRSFRVSTRGSNFDTVVSVRKGNCANISEIACNDNANDFGSYSEVTFTTDGESDYYIIVEGARGAWGRVRLKVTSF